MGLNAKGQTGKARVGRPPGTPNKVSADIKEMVCTALNMVGGAKYLARKAESHPAAFMGLVAKVLPHQIQASAGGVNLLEQLATAAMAIRAKQAGLPAPAPLVIDAQPEPTKDGKIDGTGDDPQDKDQ
jgi:hypothetical protein